MVETKRDGRVVGRMPFWLSKKLGYSFNRMPTLTHFLGPAIDEGVGGANARYMQRLTLTQELLSQLPPAVYFRQKMYRGVTDTLPFQMAGYYSSVQFTHEIAPQSEALIWKGMRDKTRNMVRKASRDMVCETSDDPDLFIDTYLSHLKTKNTAPSFDLKTCRHLIAACLSRNCGRLYLARQTKGGFPAAIFCAWDRTASYYLLSTRAADSGNGANTFLLWEAIKHASAQGLIFDFAGVGSAGSVLFFAGFGAIIQPRYLAYRAKKIPQLLQDLRLLAGFEPSTFF